VRMGEIISQRIIHPFLFGIFPILFLYTYNIYDTRISFVLLPLILILVITIFLIFSLHYLLKNYHKTGIIISLFYMLFFSYGSIFNLVSKVDNGTDRDIVIFGVEIIILGIGTFFIIRSKSDYHILTGFLNVFSTAILSISLLNIAVYAFNQSDDTINFKAIDQSNIRDNFDSEELPDIYHIILDAYGREDALKDYYNCDNSEFISFLKSKDFYVASKSNANYSKTFLSLGSMLNLNYISEIMSEVDPKSMDKSLWDHPIRDFLFFNIIKKFGYNIYALSSGYLPTELFKADVYKSQGYIEDFNDLLFNTTFLVPLVARMDKYYDRFANRRKLVLDAFNILKNMPKFSSPTYVFAHIPVPHPPVIFDDLGNPVRDSISTISREEYYEVFVKQLIYVNDEMKKVINTILTNTERPTIILIHGDHGLRSHEYWDDVDNRTNFKESLTILNAYYFHDGNYESLYDNISPVNSFRVVLNQYMGMDFDLLDERSYLSIWKKPFELIEYIEYVEIDSATYLSE